MNRDDNDMLHTHYLQIVTLRISENRFQACNICGNIKVEILKVWILSFEWETFALTNLLH